MLTAACSVTVASHNSCTSDSECSSLFGAGSVCGANGFCSAPGLCSTHADCRQTIGFGSTCQNGMCADAIAPPRCQKTVPTDLWMTLGDHRDLLVFGSQADRSDSVHQNRENATELATTVINEAGAFGTRRFGVVFCDLFGGPDNPYDEL